MPASLADPWIEEVRARGVRQVAAALGLAVKDGPSPTFPCPACGADRRGRSDGRGAAGLRRDGLGWACHRCDAHGDAVTLAALVATGEPKPRSWAAVRQACADAGLCAPDPRCNAPARARAPRLPPPPPRVETPPQRPPAAEVAALWEACVGVDRTLAHPDPADLQASSFLARRGFFPMAVAALDVARLLPLPEAFPFPAWWPARWARTWRLVVPAYEADGTLAGIHARRTDGDEAPKTRWPFGVEARGLLMADPPGRAFLRGELVPPAVIVAEGLTDLIAFALWAARTGRAGPVLAVTSGGAAGLAAVRWPAGVPCYVPTDPDKTGDKYAAEVRAALPPSVSVRRVRLGQEG